MRTSSLEITENEYLIKLRKEEFDLSFINQLLKRIEAEQLFFNRLGDDLEEDIISRKSHADRTARFDHLSEK